jgi:hypothetical protein
MAGPAWAADPQWQVADGFGWGARDSSHPLLADQRTVEVTAASAATTSIEVDAPGPRMDIIRRSWGWQGPHGRLIRNGKLRTVLVGVQETLHIVLRPMKH